MGIEIRIRFPQGQSPGWSEVAEELTRAGVSARILMIDDLPAFPAEIPDPGWVNLQLGTEYGPVTIRRVSSEIWSCTVWGNANSDLLAARDTIASACARAGNGVIEAG